MFNSNGLSKTAYSLFSFISLNSCLLSHLTEIFACRFSPRLSLMSYIISHPPVYSLSIQKRNWRKYLTQESTHQQNACIGYLLIICLSFGDKPREQKLLSATSGKTLK